ncbi:MAG: rhizopine-binding protein, partial [Devosia sp.]
QDALVAMKAGDLDVTVFQDAVSQGTVSLDTVLALAKGESVETRVFTVLELVTEANMNEYLDRN